MSKIVAPPSSRLSGYVPPSRVTTAACVSLKAIATPAHPPVLNARSSRGEKPASMKLCCPVPSAYDQPSGPMRLAVDVAPAHVVGGGSEEVADVLAAATLPELAVRTRTRLLCCEVTRVSDAAVERVALPLKAAVPTDALEIAMTAVGAWHAMTE